MRTFKFSLIPLIPLIAALGLPEQLAAGPLVYVYSVQGQFGTVDITSGSFHSLPSPDILVGNLAAASAQQLYVTDANVSSDLLALDPATGKTILIGNTGQALQGIEVSSSGALYAETASSLYSLDQSTGAATLLGDFGPGLNFAFSQGAFSPAGDLYLVGLQPGNPGTALYRVNSLNGMATLVGQNNFLVETQFFVDRALYGFTGALGSNAAGPIVTINPQTGAASAVTSQDSSLALVVSATTQIAAIPEPGTWAFSIAGIGSLFLLSLKRQL